MDRQMQRTSEHFQIPSGLHPAPCLIPRCSWTAFEAGAGFPAMGQCQGVTHLETNSHEKSCAKCAEPQGKVEEVHRDFGCGKGQVYPVLLVKK